MAVASRLTSRLEVQPIAAVRADAPPELRYEMLPATPGVSPVLQAVALLAARPDVRIGVDVVATALDFELLSHVEERLREHAVDPSRLCLEIVGAQCLDATWAAALLAAIAALGCESALDDVGGGRTSATPLFEQARFDQVKLNGRLVQRASAGCEDARHLVKTIVERARILATVIVADGVNGPDVFNYVASLGIDRCQGHWIGEPVAVATRLESAPASCR